MSFRPVPVYQETYVQGWKNRKGNYSLFFHKFAHYKNQDLKKDDNGTQVFLGVFSCDDELLQNKIDSQNRLIAFNQMGGGIIGAKLVSNLITGVGISTPLEIGMSLDFNLGVPYIPGSTLKGILRYAYCVNYGRENNVEEVPSHEAGLVALFGSEDHKEPQSGGIAFLDAYPENPKLALDIMNPHTGSYYKAKSQPDDTESPVPIKFLALEKGTKVKFQYLFLNTEAKKYQTELENAYELALTELGIGAKTMSGYGLFGDFKKESLQDLQTKIEANKVMTSEEIAEDPNAFATGFLNKTYPKWDTADKGRIGTILNELKQKNGFQELIDEAKKAVYRLLLTTSPSGKEKCKDIRKKLNNNNAGALDKEIKEACPDLFS